MQEIGNYQEGHFYWLNPDLSKSAMVYMLSFTEGGIYIGSTGNIGKRIKGHIQFLKSGKHSNKRIQQAFNASCRFGVFMLENLDNATKNTMREQFFINLLHPELNITPIACSRSVYKWDLYREELSASSKSQIVCPQCGKPLNIRIE